MTRAMTTAGPETEAKRRERRGRVLLSAVSLVLAGTGFAAWSLLAPRRPRRHWLHRLERVNHRVPGGRRGPRQ